MAFWTTQKLKQQGNLGLVAPYNAERVKAGHYELCMGCEIFITLTPKRRQRQGLGSVKLGPGQQIRIPSGQFAICLVDEEVCMPKNAMGLLSMRTGKKMYGLINVSGFHVDPGFRGKLKFAIFNAGPNSVTLTQGEPTFLLWVTDLTEEDAEPFKSTGWQDTIDVKYQAALIGKNLTLKALEKRVDFLQKCVIGLAPALVLLTSVFLGPLVSSLFGTAMRAHQVSAAVEFGLENREEILHAACAPAPSGEKGATSKPTGIQAQPNVPPVIDSHMPDAPGSPRMP